MIRLCGIACQGASGRLWGMPSEMSLEGWGCTCREVAWDRVARLGDAAASFAVFVMRVFRM